MTAAGAEWLFRRQQANGNSWRDRDLAEQKKRDESWG
jgi:hypothetical protein